jgi:hypothetical protein
MVDIEGDDGILTVPKNPEAPKDSEMSLSISAPRFTGDPETAKFGRGLLATGSLRYFYLWSPP